MVQVNQKAFPFLSNENVTVLLRYNTELKESSVYNLSQFIRTRIVLVLKKKKNNLITIIVVITLRVQTKVLFRNRNTKSDT